MNREQMLGAVESKRSVMHLRSGVVGQASQYYVAAEEPFVDPQGNAIDEDVVKVGVHHFIFRPGAFVELTAEQVHFVHACRALIDQAVAGMLRVARDMVEPKGATRASPTTVMLVRHVLTQAVESIPVGGVDASDSG